MSNALLASKIVIVEEEPRVRTIQGETTSVTGFEGVTERGPVGEAVLCTSPDDYERIFGGYVANGDVKQAIDGFFQNGGSAAWVVRTVHYTDVTDPSTKTSAKAAVTLLTGATGATSPYVQSSNAAPFNLEPGNTLVVDIDGASPATATFNAAAAARENTPAETYALANNDTLTVRINQGAVQTITFLTSEFVAIGAATAEEVAAVINAKLVGASATVTSGGTKVTITSDKRGTGSYVEVTGGTGNGALGFNTAEVQGTGNVADIDAVSVAEVKTVVEAAVAGVTVSDVSGAVRITRNTTGPSATVQVDASSTADTIFGFANAVVAGTTGAAVNTLRLDGKSDGTYAHVFKGQVTNATSGEAARFNLLVLKNGVIVETFPNLSMDDNDARYVETIVNDPTSGSRYLAAVDLDAGTGSAAGDRPVNVTSAFLSGGNDGLSGLVDTDFVGATSDLGKTGLRAFDLVDDLNLLAVPGRATSAVHNAMLTYCEVTRGGSVFAILDPPAGETATSIITYFETTAAVLGLSEFGAAYWPRIKVLNPSQAVFGKTEDNQITVPPSGHIAGVYARRDASKPGGVYESPAGVEQGILFGCLGFETKEVLEEEKRDLVFPKRINPLTSLQGGPRHIDGARTLKGNGNFPSVPERRGAIFIEQSIKNGLQFARHQGNTEELRATVSRTVEAFLQTQMKNGAFRTQNPDTAYFVDFDIPGTSLNSTSVQFSGQLVGRIGLATKKLAEWVILRFSQDTRALEEELAA